MAAMVPSSSLGRQPSWRKKLDEGGEGETSPPAPRKPPMPKEGSFTHKDPVAIFDDDSLEGQIARLEKRLKKNLPHVARANLELELEMLKDQKAMIEAGEQAAPAAAKEKAPARRKVGAVAMQEAPDEPEPPKQEKKKKLINRAAPKVVHPQTMARMQDWKKELDKRIKEQEELDGKRRTPPNQQAWFDLSAWGAGGSSPEQDSTRRESGERSGKGAEEEEEGGDALAALHGAASKVVEALAGALGLNEPQAPPEALPETRPLPKQTFSRRL